MLQGDALHTYITHPMRLLVHFCSIKFLSYFPASHQSGIAKELEEFSRFTAYSCDFVFLSPNPGLALSYAIQYD